MYTKARKPDHVLKGGDELPHPGDNGPGISMVSFDYPLKKTTLQLQCGHPQVGTKRHLVELFLLESKKRLEHLLYNLRVAAHPQPPGDLVK